MAAEGTTVLVVEDDPTVAHIYSLALERAGYRVVIATDGIDALEQLSRELPSFIFLDIRMPRMDGIATLRALTADPATRNVPVVMLSNFDDPALVRETTTLGAKEYIVKAGINPATLAGVVARWLEAG